MTGTYVGLFDCKTDVASNFEVELGDDINILFAAYEYEDYSGDAFVLFERDGKLYEVHGSHCSCYGLEGCWEPEETTIEALKIRVLAGSYEYDWEEPCGLDELKLWLEELLV